MSNRQTKVTKEEFEMLTIFHPGEIRYYVDLGTVLNRTKGARVNVRREPKAASKTKVAPGTFLTKTSTVELTNRLIPYIPGSISGRVQLLVKTELDDATTAITRQELVKRVVIAGIFTKTQVSPVVSDLLVRGGLKYVKTAGVHTPALKGAQGRFVQLSTETNGNLQTGTKQYQVYSTATRILEGDPTKVMSRVELTSKVCADLPGFSKKSAVVPAISALIKMNRLRYTGDQA